MSVMNSVEKYIVNSVLLDWWHSQRLRKLLASSPKVSGTALEIGCGKGTTSLEIVRRYPFLKLIATDVDETQIMLARKKNNSVQVSFEEADAQHLQYPSGFFDAVFAFDAHHHIENWKKALQEEHRVLKKGGTLFVLDVERPPFHRFFYKLFPHVDFTREQFITSVQNAGFAIQKIIPRFVFWIEAKKK